MHYFPPEVRRARGVFGVESIPVAVLPLCQLHKHEYNWVILFFFSSEIIIRVASVLPDKVGIMNNICTSK